MITIGDQDECMTIFIESELLMSGLWMLLKDISRYGHITCKYSLHLLSPSIVDCMSDKFKHVSPVSMESSASSGTL